MATKSKADKDLSRVTTPKFRVSYPHVFKAQAAKPGDKPKFSITMLFAKDSDLKSIQNAIKQAKIAEFGPDKANWPDDLESPWTDGDAPKNVEKEGYAGHWAIKASTQEDQRPGVVDEKMNPITNPSEFYPGCYARARVMAYVWFYPDRQKPMKKGVGFILDHVQKWGEGKSFSGKKPVDQVFTPLATGDDDEAAEETDDMDFR